MACGLVHRENVMHDADGWNWLINLMGRNWVSPALQREDNGPVVTTFYHKMATLFNDVCNVMLTLSLSLTYTQTHTHTIYSKPVIIFT